MNYICLEIMSSSKGTISNPLLMPIGEVFYVDHTKAVLDSSIKINSKAILEEILHSKDTDLQEDLKLVIRYFQGCLEETMDNPWFLKEIKDLRKKLEETEKRCDDLEEKLKHVLHNE